MSKEHPIMVTLVAGNGPNKSAPDQLIRLTPDCGFLIKLSEGEGEDKLIDVSVVRENREGDFETISELVGMPVGLLTNYVEAFQLAEKLMAGS